MNGEGNDREVLIRAALTMLAADAEAQLCLIPEPVEDVGEELLDYAESLTRNLRDEPAARELLERIYRELQADPMLGSRHGVTLHPFWHEVRQAAREIAERHRLEPLWPKVAVTEHGVEATTFSLREPGSAP